MRNVRNSIVEFIGKYLKYILPAIIALFAGLTYFNIKPDNANDQNLQLTIFVKDSQGNVAIENEGELNTSLGNRSLNEPIGAHGRTNFPDITENNIGEVFKIGIDAEGWQIIGENEFVFEGEPVDVIVERDKTLGIIKGVIFDREGQEPIDRAKILINSDTIIWSDNEGLFKILLPSSMRIQQMEERYKLTVSKEGYTTITEMYSPFSSLGEIRMEKK